MAPHNSHTVMICTSAARQDVNNMLRGLPKNDGTGETYDGSPVEFTAQPGSGTMSRMLAPVTTLNASATPWTVAPTHWLASAWELPTYEQVMTTLKAGGLETLTSRDWSFYNLNRTRAIAAGQALITRTVDWLGSELDLDAAEQRTALMQANIAAALDALGLAYIPFPPRPFPTG